MSYKSFAMAETGDWASLRFLELYTFIVIAQ